MKKILSAVGFSILAASLSAQMKNNTSCTFSVTPISKEVDDKLNEKMIFGGAYFLADSTMSDKYVTLGGKLYYRLNKTDTKEEESQKLDVKRAYAKIRPFGTNIFEAAIGKLYSYYLTGGYFALTETYTGASRWGESGVGVKSEFKGFTLGAALPVTESYVTFKKNWAANLALSYNFGGLSENLPLTLGADLLYSATGDDNEDVNTVSEKDFSECLALNYSKKNLAFFKDFSLFFAFSHNVRPYVAHTVLSPVSVVSNSKSEQYAQVKRSNLFSLAFRPTIGSVKITSESEIGHSIEGSMVPFYTALQVQFPLFGCVSLKPQFGYYAAYDTSDSSKSFDTWEIYPRFMAEIGKWTVTAGWDMFYKEITDSEYRWTWEVPITAKVRIGK